MRQIPRHLSPIRADPKTDLPRDARGYILNGATRLKQDAAFAATFPVKNWYTEISFWTVPLYDRAAFLADVEKPQSDAPRSSPGVLASATSRKFQIQ